MVNYLVKISKHNDNHYQKRSQEVVLFFSTSWRALLCLILDLQQEWVDLHESGLTRVVISVHQRTVRRAGPVPHGTVKETKLPFIDLTDC
jgi:hypothetical protein